MSVEKVETGADWLTMTTTKSRTGDTYWRIFQALSDGKDTFWQFHRFQGLERMDGSMSIGIDHRNNRAILIARGARADEIFMLKPPRPSQLSRLDIQTTVVFDTPQRDLLKQVYEEGGGAVKKKSRIENNEGGETVYLGSRHSQLFVRVYDAGVRHKLAPAAKMFRYEIEIKKPLALPLAEVMWDKGTAKEMRYVMADWMVDTLLKRNITPPWERSLLSEQIDSLTIRKKNENSTFAWLGDQVAAAIEKLLKSGYTKDELLGVLFPSRSDAEL